MQPNQNQTRSYIELILAFIKEQKLNISIPVDISQANILKGVIDNFRRLDPYKHKISIEYLSRIRERLPFSLEYLRTNHRVGPTTCEVTNVFWNSPNQQITWQVFSCFKKEFWLRFKTLIGQLENYEISGNMEKNIHSILDKRDLNIITPQAVEKFFTDWFNPVWRYQAENTTIQIQIQPQGIQNKILKLKVLKGVETDQRFKAGAVIEFTRDYIKYDGLEPIKLQHPGVISAGRKCKDNPQPDIIFPNSLRQISRSQFQISLNQEGFQLFCLSASNPTSVVLDQKPTQLQQKMLIHLFPSSKFLEVTYLRDANPNQLAKYLRRLSFGDHPQALQEQNQDWFTRFEKINQSDTQEQAKTLQKGEDTWDLKGTTQEQKQATLPQPEISVRILEGSEVNLKHDLYNFQSSKQQSVSIGRENNCDIKIPNFDGIISMKYSEGNWTIQDNKNYEKNSHGALLFLKTLQQLKSKTLSRPLLLEKDQRFLVSDIIFEVQ